MKKIGTALLLVLLAALPGMARSTEDAVLETIEREQKRAAEVFERRQEKLDVQMKKQAFREARARDARAFCRALIDRDFDAFVGMLDREGREDVLFLVQLPLKILKLDEHLEQPGMEVVRQAWAAKTPEGLPAGMKASFLENFTGAFVRAVNHKSGLTLRDVELLDFDYRMQDPIAGRIEITKRLKGKEAGKNFFMHEEAGEWKVDLGLHAHLPELEAAIREGLKKR